MGEPAALLFNFFERFAQDYPQSVPALQFRTIELFDDVRSEIPANDFPAALLLFAAIHRFAAIIVGQPFAFDLQAKITELFGWLLPMPLPRLLNEFRICTRYEMDSPLFAAALHRITDFRMSLLPPIGNFLWERLVKAVDCELANQLILDYQYGTKDEIRKGIRCAAAVCRMLRISLVVFTQALNFVLDYEQIIAKRIPFEERGKDLPPQFLLSIVFSGKKKGVIPLEVSDQRILNWATYLKVAIAPDTQVVADESQTVVPLSLWK
jgi:hypothetical protein